MEAGDGSAGTVVVVLPGARARGVGLLCSSALSSPPVYTSVHVLVVVAPTTSPDCLFISKIHGRSDLGWKT